MKKKSFSETLRSTALSIQAAFNDFDGTWKLYVDREADGKLKPVFIIGPPRSGSTLFYQLLLSHFQLCYISNIVSGFPKYMLRISRLFPSLASGYRLGLKKDYYGFLPGIKAPSEAGKIFDKWFNEDDFDENAAKIAASIKGLQSITGKPFVIKNLDNSLRIMRLRKLFPESRFIVIQRDPLFTTQSILLSRIHINRDPQKWWSVKVPGFEKMDKKEAIDQVVWQVEQINRIIDRDLSDIPEQVFKLQYEEFCRSPVTVLDKIAVKFNLATHEKVFENFPKLSVSEKIKLPENDWRQLEAAVKKTFG